MPIYLLFKEKGLILGNSLFCRAKMSFKLFHVELILKTDFIYGFVAHRRLNSRFTSTDILNHQAIAALNFNF